MASGVRPTAARSRSAAPSTKSQKVRKVASSRPVATKPAQKTARASKLIKNPPVVVFVLTWVFVSLAGDYALFTIGNTISGKATLATWGGLVLAILMIVGAVSGSVRQRTSVPKEERKPLLGASTKHDPTLFEAIGDFFARVLRALWANRLLLTIIIALVLWFLSYGLLRFSNVIHLDVVLWLGVSINNTLLGVLLTYVVFFVAPLFAFSVGNRLVVKGFNMKRETYTKERWTLKGKRTVVRRRMAPLILTIIIACAMLLSLVVRFGWTQFIN